MNDSQTADHHKRYNIPSKCTILEEGVSRNTRWFVVELANSPLLENVHDYAGFLYFPAPDHPWLKNPRTMFGGSTYHEGQTIGFIADDAELFDPNSHWTQEMVKQEMIKMCGMAASGKMI